MANPILPHHLAYAWFSLLLALVNVGAALYFYEPYGFYVMGVVIGVDLILAVKVSLWAARTIHKHRLHH